MENIKYGLSEILDSLDIDDKNIYEEALDIFSKIAFEFVDCVLTARHKIY